MGTFFIQIGIFIFMALIFFFIAKGFGKYGVYFLIAITIGSLVFALIYSKDLKDRYLWLVILFGITSLSGVIRKIMI